MKSESTIINEWLAQRLLLSLRNDEFMYHQARSAARERLEQDSDEQQQWYLAGGGINDRITEWLEENVSWDELRIMIADTLALDGQLGEMLAQGLFNGIDDLLGDE